MIIETAYGRYQIAGLDRFAIAGDVEAEVQASVEQHVQSHGQPPQAVTWDDVVLDLRPSNLRLLMQRVFIPARDPFIARMLDAQGRAALRLPAANSAPRDVNEVLASLAVDEAAEIAHAPGLLRFVGWPEAAPWLATPPPRPSRKAASIGIIINYHDKSDTTITCLKQIRAQSGSAALELVLVNNRSQATEQRAVIEAASDIFAGDSRITIRHLDYDGAFNHSDQCNRAAEMTGAEVLVMMSNDCLLLDPDLLQTIADWALEPGLGLVGPRLVGDGGTVTGAGITLAPTERNGRPGWRLQDAELDYLSRMVRQSCGASFACAAVARETWIAMGGADAQEFTIDYNDADFALRLSAAGYQHLYVGTCQAYHQPGRSEERTRANSNALHDALEMRHSFQNVERSSPYAVPLKRMPAFNHASANQIGDLVRIYRLAVNSRTGEPAGPAAIGLVRAFESLITQVGGRCDLQSVATSGEFSPDRRLALVEKLRQVCDAYLKIAPPSDLPERYLRSFEEGADAFQRLAAMAARQPMPGDERPAVEDVPQRRHDLFTFSDLRIAAARDRLVVFADRLGPAQQIAFVEGLKRGRGDGSIAVRIVTESDLAEMDDGKLQSLRQSLLALMPTACIFSHFGARAGYAAIAAILADAAFDRTARIFHAAEDVFAPSLLLGAETYRRARHPDRIHTLQEIALGADLILAATPQLGARLAERFGPHKIAVPAVAVGGEPFAPRAADRLRVGIAARGAVLAMLEPLAAENPGLDVEHIQDEALLNDWPALCRALRARQWDVGLAPERDDLKPSSLWAAYAQAGIATFGADSAPHRDLACYGAISLARPDAWQAALQDLLDRPARRLSIVRAANRLLKTRYSWDQVEDAMLGFLHRTAAARQEAPNLTMARSRRGRRRTAGGKNRS